VLKYEAKNLVKKPWNAFTLTIMFLQCASGEAPE
jgi:hypothetical protein